jgi:hypothetical protein
MTNKFAVCKYYLIHEFHVYDLRAMFDTYCKCTEQARKYLQHVNHVNNIIVMYATWTMFDTYLKCTENVD